MAGYWLLYTGVFSLYSLMEVLGLMPQEVRSAGVTLTGLFSGLYGDQVIHAACDLFVFVNCVFLFVQAIVMFLNCFCVGFV